MCHHPDNETEWPYGTALLPDMVLCFTIQTMRLNDLMAPPCCQTWFYVSSSRQWDWMTSWHRLVARHGSMCHHPDNETEWPHGTALLPGMGCLCLVNRHCTNIFFIPTHKAELLHKYHRGCALCVGIKICIWGWINCPCSYLSLHTKQSYYMSIIEAVLCV